MSFVNLQTEEAVDTELFPAFGSTLVPISKAGSPSNLTQSKFSKLQKAWVNDCFFLGFPSLLSRILQPVLPHQRDPLLICPVHIDHQVHRGHHVRLTPGSCIDLTCPELSRLAALFLGLAMPYPCLSINHRNRVSIRTSTSLTNPVATGRWIG